MRGQFVRLILLQVIDNNNGTIRLIPIFSKLGPSDLGPIVAEDRRVCGTLFPRGDLLSILTLEIDNVDLEKLNQSPDIKPRVHWAHVLLGVPCGRQVRVQRGIHHVGFGDIEIILPSERFDRGTLENRSHPHPINRTALTMKTNTHVLRSGEQINKLVAQRPNFILLSELHREQGLVLRSTIGIPMTDISLIINQRRGSPTIPRLIPFLNPLQLPILIDVIRKHKDTRPRDIPEVIRGRGGE